MSNLNVNTSLSLTAYDNTANASIYNRSVQLALAGTVFESFLYLACTSSPTNFPFFNATAGAASLIYVRNLDNAAVVTITLNGSNSIALPPNAFIVISSPTATSITASQFSSNVPTSLIECAFSE